MMASWELMTGAHCSLVQLSILLLPSVQALDVRWPFLESIFAAQKGAMLMNPTTTPTATSQQPQSVKKEEWTQLWNRAIDLYRTASPVDEKTSALPKRAHPIVLDELTQLIVALGQLRPQRSQTRNDQKEKEEEENGLVVLTPQTSSLFEAALDAIEAQLRPGDNGDPSSNNSNQENDEDTVQVLYRAAECIERAMNDPNVSEQQIQELVNSYARVREQLLSSSSSNSIKGPGDVGGTRGEPTTSAKRAVEEEEKEKEDGWWKKLWPSSSLTGTRTATPTSAETGAPPPSPSMPLPPSPPTIQIWEQQRKQQQQMASTKEPLMPQPPLNPPPKIQELRQAQEFEPEAPTLLPISNAAPTIAPSTPPQQQQQMQLQSTQSSQSSPPPLKQLLEQLESTAEQLEASALAETANVGEAGGDRDRRKGFVDSSCNPQQGTLPPWQQEQGTPSSQQQLSSNSPVAYATGEAASERRPQMIPFATTNQLAEQLEATLLSDTGDEDPVQSFVDSLRREDPFSSSSSSNDASARGTRRRPPLRNEGPALNTVTTTGPSSSLSPTAFIRSSTKPSFSTPVTGGVDNTSSNNSTARIERFIDRLRSIQEGGNSPRATSQDKRQRQSKSTINSSADTVDRFGQRAQPSLADEENLSASRPPQRKPTTTFFATPATSVSDVGDSRNDQTPTTGESFDTFRESPLVDAESLRNRLTSILQYDNLVPEEGDNDKDATLRERLQKLEGRMTSYLNDEPVWEEIATAGEESWDAAKNFWVNEASPVVSVGLARAWKQISTAWSVAYRTFAQPVGPRWALPPSSESNVPAKRRRYKIIESLRPDRWTGWTSRFSWVGSASSNETQVLIENDKDLSYSSLKDVNPQKNDLPLLGAGTSAKTADLPLEMPVVSPRESDPAVPVASAMNNEVEKDQPGQDWSRLAAEWVHLNRQTSDSGSTAADSAEATTNTKNSLPLLDPPPQRTSQNIAENWSRLAEEWAILNRENKGEGNEVTNGENSNQSSGDRVKQANNLVDSSPVSTNPQTTNLEDNKDRDEMVVMDSYIEGTERRSTSGDQRNNWLQLQAQLAGEWSRRNSDDLDETSSTNTNGAESGPLHPPGSFEGARQLTNTQLNDKRVHDATTTEAEDSWHDLAEAWANRNQEREETVSFSVWLKPENIPRLQLSNRGTDWKQLERDWADRNRDSRP